MKIKGFLHVKFSFFYRRHKPDLKLILNKDRITVKVVDGNWNTIDYHGKFLPLCFTPHQSILKVILVIISYLPHAVGCIFLTLMLTCVFEKCTAARGTNFNIFFFFCNDKKKKDVYLGSFSHDTQVTGSSLQRARFSEARHQSKHTHLPSCLKP